MLNNRLVAYKLRKIAAELNNLTQQSQRSFSRRPSWIDGIKILRDRRAFEIRTGGVERS